MGTTRNCVQNSQSHFWYSLWKQLWNLFAVFVKALLYSQNRTSFAEPFLPQRFSRDVFPERFLKVLKNFVF